MAVSGNVGNTGLLIMRVGIGILFIYHGYPKITGGPETWSGVGAAMGTFGISFAPYLARAHGVFLLPLLPRLYYA